MILYLGLDPHRWPHAGPFLHYPVIRTEKLDSAELCEALRLWPRFTHVVFTSKSGVRHWWEAQPMFNKTAIAIGEGTAEELRIRDTLSLHRLRLVADCAPQRVLRLAPDRKAGARTQARDGESRQR